MNYSCSVLPSRLDCSCAITSAWNKQAGFFVFKPGWGWGLSYFYIIDDPPSWHLGKCGVLCLLIHALELSNITTSYIYIFFYIYIYIYNTSRLGNPAEATWLVDRGVEVLIYSFCARSTLGSFLEYSLMT